MTVDYVVVPTSNIDYQSWQIRLLNWSRKKVCQQGKLILLNSADIANRPFDDYEALGSDIIHIKLHNWAKEWKDNNNGDWWGGIPNKYNALKWMTDNMDLRDTDVLFFMDPDMLFLQALPNFDVQGNDVVGCDWEGYKSLKDWSQHDYGIMYPFMITFGKLKHIVDDYVANCIKLRKDTGQWIAEMWGLDYAIKHNNCDVLNHHYLAHCTAWWDGGVITELPMIVHYPNVIPDINGDKLWFKQDFTTRQKVKTNHMLAKNEIGKALLRNVSQYQTDYIYWPKWDFPNLFNLYDGSAGYVVFKPWPGGFNNIRMSFELAISIAYIKNRTLVLPPTYSMYLLEGESNLNDFFNLGDLGIKTLRFDKFCDDQGIQYSWDAIRDVSYSVDLGEGSRNGTSDLTLNFEKVKPPKKFTKWKRLKNWEDLVNDDAITLFFDSNLLGNFYQVIYSSKMQNVKQLLAKHLRYRNDILDHAWDFINELGDQTYYATHIRRGDFQYKDLLIDGKALLDNIKDRVPFGSKLYIATDHDDKSFFKPLADKYDVYYYNDLIPDDRKIEPNIIPIIEQLICTRSIKFIGMDYSTLSSQIYRLRGYMDDTRDKEFHVNTYPYKATDQCSVEDSTNFIANWHRDYKDVWDFYEPAIFISIASYKDGQVEKTIESAISSAANPDRVFIGVHVQDTGTRFNEISSNKYPNVRYKFTPHKETKGVVTARVELIEELYKGEPYYLQVDSHMRFKDNWDNILLNQLHSIPSDKLIITTYPNEFIYPDPGREYLKLPYNAPIVFERFLTSNPKDNRFKSRNLPSLKDYDVVDIHRISAGFLFTDRRWLDEVQLPKVGIVYNGEEDYLTYLSYLKGWDIKAPSEATVWHNYDWRDRDGKPYRDHNPSVGKNMADNAIEIINDMLFNHTYHRSIEELEKYLGTKFKR